MVVLWMVLVGDSKQLLATSDSFDVASAIAYGLRTAGVVVCLRRVTVNN